MESPSPSLPFPSLRAARWWIIGGFFALAFLVYGASLSNQFVRWDDGLLIYENPAIRSITPASLRTIFTMYDPELYIPLTFFTYQLDFLIGGTHATLYHLQNLLWHTLNALLVTWLALLLTRRRWVALACGLLFLVHPLHTEAVAWASARKDVLSTFFLLLSIIGYLLFQERKQRRFLLLSLGAFALGLLAKVTILTLPVLLLLIDFRNRRPWTLRMLAEKAPYFFLTILFGIIAWIGKTGVLASSTPLEKVLMAPMSVMFYLKKIFFPLHLSVLYPFFGEVSLSRADILLPLILLCALVLVTLASLRFSREMAFGVGFFLVALSPTLFNFAKGDFFYFASDRYAYVPSIGIFLLVLVALDRLFGRFEKTATPGRVLLSLLWIILAFFAYRQSLTWKNSEALFTHTLALSPDSHVALNNLGNVYRNRGENARAIASYEKAVAVLERYGRRGPGLATGESKILSNLASAERQENDLVKARETFDRALVLNPRNEYAHLGLGIVAATEGKTAEAEADYRKALEIAPSFATAHVNLGTLLVYLQRTEEGIQEFERAIAVNPYYPQAYYNLGTILQKLKKTSEAIEAYEKAVALVPTFVAARINLGILLYNQGKIDEARAQFEAVLTSNPDNKQARSALQQIEGQK